MKVDNESCLRHVCCAAQTAFSAGEMALSWSRTVDLFPEMNPNGLYEEHKIDYEEVEYTHNSSSEDLTLGSSSTNLALDSSIASEESHASEKNLVRKIDLRLLPILGGLYAISLVDRVNVRLSHSQVRVQDLSG